MKKLNGKYLMCKRLIDIVLSLLGIILLSPFIIIIALIIKLTSKGPILFMQERIGYKGKSFKIFKFRTMIADAEKVGKQITVHGDSRITRIGKILRKLKLDELPQLFNVLIGDMSLVGPRPEVKKYVNMYTAEQREVLAVRPGITDFASIEFSNENEILGMSNNPEETYINEIMPVKLKLNLKYINGMSFLTDLKLIYLTLEKVFINKNKSISGQPEMLDKNTTGLGL